MAIQETGVDLHVRRGGVRNGATLLLIHGAGANGDGGKPGERILSTTNRNFENRQGRGVRTHLVGPALAAAAAIAGKIVDVPHMKAGE